MWINWSNVKSKEFLKVGDSCVENCECQTNNCENKKCEYISDKTFYQCFSFDNF